MKRCPSCQGTFPDTKRFCSRCGAALDGGSAISEPTPLSSTGTASRPDPGERCPVVGWFFRRNEGANRGRFFGSGAGNG
jgi:hypothetical protein